MLGCYGDKIARTPNLDRLATQGMRFVNSYVTNASCSSSRSSLLTGLYPHQTGFFLPNNTPVGQIGLAYPGSGYAMDPRVITMPQLLKAAGYRTGIIGKLHVFPEASFPFDYKAIELNTRDIELVAQRAEKFLGKKPQQPFFLMVNYGDPHEPYYRQVNGYPQQPFGPTDVKTFPWAGIDTPEFRNKTAGYYNGVARMDAGVGMLLNKPKIINNSLVSTVDILPTVLQQAGVKVPQNLAGRSLKQLFFANTTGWRRVLCAEYTSHTRDYFNPRRSIRGDRWKYILNLLPNRNNGIAEQLYNLDTDRNEFNNLAGRPEYEGAQNFLRGELLKWRQQTADPLLDPAVLAAMTQEHKQP